MGSPVPTPVGIRFGRLTVLMEGVARILPSGQTRRRMDCRCDCGKLVTIDLHSLRRGASQSCGCLRSECSSKRTLKHGQTVGKRPSENYLLWIHIKRRIMSNPYYTSRDISMCTHWLHNFAAFDAWMTENLGGRPEGKTLDRINNDGNYEPGNLRWATHKEQLNNTSKNILVTFEGMTLTVTQWEEHLGFRRDTLRQRLFKLNWPVEKAFTTPVQVHQ